MNKTAFENPAFYAHLEAGKPDARTLVEMIPFINAEHFGIFLTSNDERSEWKLPEFLKDVLFQTLRQAVIFEAWMWASDVERGALEPAHYAEAQDLPTTITAEEEVGYGK